MMSANLQATGPFARLRASKSTLGIPRAMMLALVFVALAFVSLRPFCQLAFANDGQSGVAGFVTAAGHAPAEHPDRGDTPCGTGCTSIKDGTLVKPAEPLASWTRSGSLGAVLFASTGLLLFVRSRNPARRLLVIPPERSFYARSARILR